MTSSLECVRRQQEAIDNSIAASFAGWPYRRRIVLMRAQIAAGSSHEAIDLVRDRLRRKLSQLGKHPASLVIT